MTSLVGLHLNVKLFLLLAALFFYSCRTFDSSPGFKPQTEEAAAAAQQAIQESVALFEGDLAAAMVQAARDRRALVVVWRAAWCGHCWHLEHAIFAQRQVVDASSSFVLVKLDAQEVNAQMWSERLGLDNYPRVFVLSPSGQLRFVLDHFVNGSELADALSAVANKSDGPRQSLQRIAERRADPLDWQLVSFVDWPQLIKRHEAGLSVLLQQMLFAANNTPVRDPVLRARLGAKLLHLSGWLADVRGDDERIALFLSQVRRDQEQFITHSLRDRRYGFAARWFWLNDIHRTLQWLQLAYSLDRRKVLATDWQRYMLRLDGHPVVDASFRLHLANALLSEKHVTLIGESLEKKSLQYSTELFLAMTQRDLDNAATRAYVEFMRPIAQRLEMISEWRSWVASAQLNDQDWAWYYQVLQAELLASQGAQSEAISMFDSILDVLPPGANRIEVILRKLAAFNELGHSDGIVVEGINQYYETAFALEDGFSGLAGRQASDKLSQVLTDDARRFIERHLIEQYQARCQQKRSGVREICHDHFAGVLQRLP